MQIAWKQPHTHGLPLRIRKSVAGLCLSIGLVASGLMSLPGYALNLSNLTVSFKSTTATEYRVQQQTDAMLVPRSPALADGVYLYGQSPQRDQLGTAYLVFEVVAEQVVGAFYMPHSSFDCFHGVFQNNQLALQITDSYEQVSYPFAIALQETSLATTTGGATPAVLLEGFHRVEAIDQNDQRILETCKADLSNAIQDSI